MRGTALTILFIIACGGLGYGAAMLRDRFERGRHG